jgi:hypothetical protein
MAVSPTNPPPMMARSQVGGIVDEIHAERTVEAYPAAPRMTADARGPSPSDG